MKYCESEEMYLETILLLKKDGKRVRAIDVAAQLGYSRPSVSRAVNILKRDGYINVGDGGEINLTDNGKVKAENIYERHRVISKLLEMCGADKMLADENACRIEHVISDELFQVLKNYIVKRV